MSLEAAGLVDLLRVHAGRNPHALYAHFLGEPLTFSTLDAKSDALASSLRERARPGEAVAVMMRNSVETLAVIFGLAKAGLVWVPVNVQQVGQGLRYILEHSKPTLVIADAPLRPSIDECGVALPQHSLLVHATDGGVSELVNILESGARFDVPAPAADATCAIMYTSGTTGRPKGVMVSHRMIRKAGDAVGLLSDAGQGDTLFVWEPFYHIGGAQLLSLPFTRGVSLAMVDRFSASRFWEQVREYGATHIHYLGGILQILLKQPESPLDREHAVRVAWGGGCPAEIWLPFQKRFGVQIRECYGMTEASSLTTCNRDGLVGSVGRPVPWFGVEIVDAGGAPLSVGERGEIVVRTSVPGAITAGYYENPEATAKALRNGALHTGDLGSLDAAGNLYFHGRMTESVRCKGENVSAWEVEHVAASHPAIEDCAMIGVAADVGEQDIKLFVKRKPGTDLKEEEFSAWLSRRLAAYQNPRYIAFVLEFERTPSQRIMKHTLSRRLDDCWDRTKVVSL